MPISVGSLCAGAGGLDFGFHQAGASFEFVYDTDSVACDTYRRNLNADVQKVDALTLQSSRIAGVDLILAGPPCQGFSSLGSRDASDPRNSVLVAIAKLIASATPRLFVIENVPGLKSLHAGRFAQAAVDLLNENQQASIVEVKCADFGVPQHRKRVLILGGQGDLGREFIQKTDQLSQSNGERRSVGEFILPSKDLDGLPNHKGREIHAGWYYDVMPHIDEGQKLCDTRRGSSAVHSWEIPEVFGRVSELEMEYLRALSKLRRVETDRRWEQIGDGKPVLISDLAEHMDISLDVASTITKSLIEMGYVVDGEAEDVDLARRFNGRFRRLDSHSISPAVTKDFGFVRTVIHPKDDRGLTPRECARLQTFPDWFEFAGGLGDQYRLVANAFPPRVSMALAKVAWQVLGVGRTEHA